MIVYSLKIMLIKAIWILFVNLTGHKVNIHPSILTEFY